MPSGRPGCVRSSAWHWLFSSQHRTQRLVRRLQIKPDHVPELGRKLRVVRQLEGAGEMRLDRVGGPEPLHRRLGDPRGPGHRAHRPARAPGRRLRRAGDDRGLGRERHARLASPALGLDQAAQAARAKALLPQRHHRPVDPDPPRRLGLAQAVGAVQHNLRAPHLALRRCRPLHQPRQGGALLGRDRQGPDRTRHTLCLHHPSTYAWCFVRHRTRMLRCGGENG